MGAVCQELGAGEDLTVGLGVGDQVVEVEVVVVGQTEGGAQLGPVSLE